ncbi:MAG: glycosyl transferase [Phycisphaeraceae bacterium]|nr:MAG: glycosyl transferase [Phycisphaeraceae bacterium]
MVTPNRGIDPPRSGRAWHDHDPASDHDTPAGANGNGAAGSRAIVTRIDAHCHSKASSKPVMAAAGIIGCPECYSEPEAVYDQAMARGMDLVTITDHDTIAGAMTLVERGFDRFIVGQEVSVKFPEDKCLLHVLVWGLNPDLDEEIDTLDLRDDVYAFAAWLRDRDLAHAFAHPLYVQNGRLSRWHIERAALLFRGFETTNGAHADQINGAIRRFLVGLTPERVAEISHEHGMEPLWPEAWRKARTGGSDDHALLNVGRTWTQIETPQGKLADADAFFRRVMRFESESGGLGGHSALLAHQFTSVGAHYFSRSLYTRRTPIGKYVSAKMLRFFGVQVTAPTKKKVAAYKVAQKVWLKRKKKSIPVLRALRRDMSDVLDKYPNLRHRLDPDTWADGTAVSQHEEMADFVQDLIDALSRSMVPGARKAFGKRDAGKISEYLISYAMLLGAQAPYMISLFYQNKERNFLDKFEHEAASPGSGISVLERPMKVSLFTDTIADINGVSRFIQNVAEQSLVEGRDLEVITSTKLDLPDIENIKNFEPAFSTRMPRYDELDMVLPPIMRILRHVDKHQPDVIHISTPGPVGCVGFIAAKMLRVPVLGVYHTDFPAYVDRLFDDHAMTKMTEKFMRAFYKPFSAIFTRSDDYVRSLTALGMPADSIVRLMPGFDAHMFHPRCRDLAIWDRLGISQGSVKVLYCGRVSVEKNLPALVHTWKKVHKAAKARGVEAELIVVGDGPYRAKMTKELAGKGAHFLGFRHGDELSALYASSDMFVFPSTTDTLGQVVMESQGSSLPVIVTDQGGPKEVVRDGETGFVLPADDTDAWVETLVGLIADPGKRRLMGDAAHEYMQGFSLVHSFEHFWQVHTEAWHEHLRRQGIERAEPERGASPAGVPARVG